MHGRRSASQRRQAGETGEPSIGSGAPMPNPDVAQQEAANDPTMMNVPPEYMAQFMEEMRRSQQEFLTQTRNMWQENHGAGEGEHQGQGRMGQGSQPPQPTDAQGAAGDESDQDLQRDRRQERRSRMLLDYYKAAPPKFTGDGDPIKAQNFVIESESRFESMGIPDRRKVKLAAAQREGPAQKWWRNTKAVYGSRMSWNEFVQLFYAQYFPIELQRSKQLEFHSLVQGEEMSVLEYAQRFNELGEFCPQEMKDEDGKALKFEGGLKSEIRTQLATHLGDT